MACKCDLCAIWFPLFDRLQTKASPEDKEGIDAFIDMWMNESMDGNVAQAKLEGSWPGYEGVPGIIYAYLQATRE